MVFGEIENSSEIKVLWKKLSTEIRFYCWS